MARIHQRAEVIREIVLESSAGKRPSRISDMSMGGCYIESITNFHKGDAIEFDLENTAGDVLRFSGIVAYVLEGFGFGLSFSNITPSHEAFLRRVLPSTPSPTEEVQSNLLEL